MGFSEISNQPSAQKILRTIFFRGLKPAFMLFIGPNGAGKKQAALVLAQSYLCANPHSQEGACGECPNCLRVQKNTHPDCHVIDKDYQEVLLDIRGGSSNLRIETMREVLRRLQQRPFESSLTLAIVDKAHDLTTQAQSALLKALEEAPRHLCWIWLTSSEEFLLPTVSSRANFKIAFKPQPRPIAAEKQPFHLTTTEIYEMSQRVARFRSFAQARKEVSQILSEAKSQFFNLWQGEGDSRYLLGLKAILQGEKDLELNLTPSLVLESTLLQLAASTR